MLKCARRASLKEVSAVRLSYVGCQSVVFYHCSKQRSCSCESLPDRIAVLM